MPRRGIEDKVRVTPRVRRASTREGMRDRVGECIEALSHIGNHEVLDDTCIGRLGRNPACVFDDATKPTVDKAGTDNDPAAELPLEAADEFVDVFHLGSGIEALGGL